MVFGVDDESQFYATRELLMTRFTEWMVQGGVGDTTAVGSAELALDWKWGYGDGDLSTWTLTHFDELLLDWFPRKVMMPPDEAPDVLSDLKLFVLFLDASTLLSTQSSSAKSTVTHLGQIAPSFSRALADRSRHGMGKSLFGAMSDLGMTFNPDDPTSMATLMESFNALSYEERSAILGIDDDRAEAGGNPAMTSMVAGVPHYMSLWVQLVTGIDLPPARSMTKTKRNELAASTQVVEMFATVGAFFDRPRKLTKVGNLSIADGLDLAELLNSDGDVRTNRANVRSSEDLAGLAFRLDLARKCGVIKAAKGIMSSTVACKKRSATDQHDRAMKVLLKFGPLAYGGRSRWRNRQIEDVIDGGVPALLTVLFALDGAPIPYDSLLETAQQVAGESVRQNSYITANYIDGLTSNLFNELWQLFELFGVVECADYVTVDGRDPFETPTGDVLDALEGVRVSASQLTTPVPATVGLRLTELGQAVVAPYLSGLGMVIPEVGTMTEQPLSHLIVNVSQWHRSLIEAEFAAWVGANGVDQAIADLIQIAQTANDTQTRIAIVELAGSLGERSEMAVRALAATNVSGHATVWLLTNQFDEPNDDNMRIAMLTSFELLSLQCTGDPDDDAELLEIISTMFESLSAAEFCELLWRVEEPWAGDVLAAVGRLHPDKAIAKQARKAVMQHHTHLANLKK
jgi:hypothetical protein